MLAGNCSSLPLTVLSHKTLVLKSDKSDKQQRESRIGSDIF